MGRELAKHAKSTENRENFERNLASFAYFACLASSPPQFASDISAEFLFDELNNRAINETVIVRGKQHSLDLANGQRYQEIEMAHNRLRETMMKAVYKTAAPYADDAMNLPVHDVDTAIPYYEKMFGFRVVSRKDSPYKSVVLARDSIQIGLAENGGDPSQEGCFFEVDDVEAAFAELKSNGLEKEEAGYRIDHHGDASYKVFFVIAPDGLCYCLGERKS